MKKLLFALLLLPTSALANPGPFRYETPCYLEASGMIYEDTCVVIETRLKGGALNSRNIFSNRFGLTIKSRFDKEKGFMTWDSHNKYEYKWEYKLGYIPHNTKSHSYVMPGFLVEDVSWD